MKRCNLLVGNIFFQKSFWLQFSSLIVLSILSTGSVAYGQDTSITSSGLNTEVNINAGSEVVNGNALTRHDITGGTRAGGGAGTTLLHSFGNFSVGSGDIANFLNNDGLATNNIVSRVTGGNPSQIFGMLRTTGFGDANLFLFNPSGVLFGPDAVLDIAGSVHFSTANYLNIAGSTFDFSTTSLEAQALSNADVTAFGFTTSNPSAIEINQSLLRVADGRTVSIIGGDSDVLDVEPGVKMVGGRIEAPGGNINVVSVGSLEEGATVGEVTLTSGGATLSGFAKPGNIELTEGATLTTSTSHAAPGGRVLIRGGQVILDNAVVEANALLASQAGGKISVLGNEVGLIGTTTLSASGGSRGGTILVGGNFQGKGPAPNAQKTYVGPNVTIAADATNDGDGGTVIVWADVWTKFYGFISAQGGPDGGDGGFAEVSGKESLVYRGFTDLSAANGNLGTLLLDPLRIQISPGTADGDDDPNGSDSELIHGTNLPGTILFADEGDDGEGNPVVPFVIFESEIEGQSQTADIVLEARQSISIDPTDEFFGNDDVLLAPDSNLTLRTRNSAVDEAGGIDLTSGFNGANLEFRTQGTGTITIEASTDGGAIGDVTVGLLTTANQAINISTGHGDISLENTISAGSGTLDMDAGNNFILGSGGSIRSSGAGNISTNGGNVTLHASDIFHLGTGGQLPIGVLQPGGTLTVDLRSQGGVIQPQFSTAFIDATTVNGFENIDIIQESADAQVFIQNGTDGDIVNMDAGILFFIDMRNEGANFSLTVNEANDENAFGPIFIENSSGGPEGGIRASTGNVSITAEVDIILDDGEGVNEPAIILTTGALSLNSRGGAIRVFENDGDTDISTGGDVTLGTAEGIGTSGSSDESLDIGLTANGGTLTIDANGDGFVQGGEGPVVPDVIDIDSTTGFAFAAINITQANTQTSIDIENGDANNAAVTTGSAAVVDLDFIDVATEDASFSFTLEEDDDASDNIRIFHIESGTQPVTVIAENGDITVEPEGETIEATGASNILLDAQGGTLTVNDPIITQGGTVDLMAANDVIFGTEGDVSSNGGNITVTADADGDVNGAGGALTMADDGDDDNDGVTVINAGSGSILLQADEDITVGRLLTTAPTATAVVLNSTSGGVVDGGDFGGEDVEAPTGGLVIDAVTVVGGNGGFLETQVASLDVNLSNGIVGIANIIETDAVIVNNLTVRAATLVAGGAITDAPGAPINISGFASFNTVELDANGNSLGPGTSSITLGDNGVATTNFGSLSLVGGDVRVTEDSATNLLTTFVASLNLTSAGAITDEPGTTLTVTGLAAFDAGANPITLGDDQTDITNFGSLSLAGGIVSLSEDSATNLTGVNVEDLDLTSAGPITDATDIEVSGAASFDAGLNDITLGDQPGDTTNFGSLSFNGGDVSITEDSATVLDQNSIAASLTLTSNGSITDEPGTALNVAGLANFDAGNNSITLGDNEGDVVNFGSLSLTGGDVQVTEDRGILLNEVNVAGLDLTAGQSIGDEAGASINVGEASFESGSAEGVPSPITLGDDPDDTTNFGSLSVNSGGDVTVTEDSATLLAGVIANTFSLTSAGAITDATDISVVGAASFNAGSNDITLGDNSNDTTNFGTLNLTGGNVTVSEDSATVLAGVNAASLNLTSAGSITDLADIIVSGAARFNAGSNAITLGDQPGVTTNFGSLSFVGSNVTLNIDSDFTLAGADVVTLLLDTMGTLTVTGPVTTSQGGAVTLRSQSPNTIILNAPINAPGGTVGLETNGNIVDNSDASVDVTASSLAIVADGVGTGSGTDDVLETQVSNLAALVGDGGIDLANTGDVSLTTVTPVGMAAVVGVTSDDGNINIQAASEINVDQPLQASGSGTVALAASEAINVNSQIQSDTGAVSLDAGTILNIPGSITTGGGAINLDAESDIIFSGTTLAIAAAGQNVSDIVIESGNDLLVTNASVSTSGASGGNITATAPNNITISGSLISTQIAANGGDINIDPPVVSIEDSSLLANGVGTITIGGEVVLINAGSTITPTPIIIIKGQSVVEPPVVTPPIIDQVATQLVSAVPELPQNIVGVPAMFASTFTPCNGGEFSSFIRRGRDSVPPEPPALLDSPMLADTLDFSARIPIAPTRVSKVSVTKFELESSPWQEVSLPLLAFKCGG